VGKPINSYADDFAFGIDGESKKGFFSSNRGENIHTFVYDDIYWLIENEPIKDVNQARIFGIVIDKDTHEPLANTTVFLFEEDGKEYTTVTTDEKGHYETETDYFTSYHIRAEKKEYDSDEKVSETELGEQEINFELKRNQLEMVPGADLGPLLSINDILFDFDKSNIRPDALVELEKLIA